MPSTSTDVVASIRRWCAQTPEALAASDGSRRLTYADLAAASAEAKTLLADVPEGVPVGIRASRGIGAVRAIVGTMMAGHPYVPIDVRWPSRRVADVGAIVGLGAVLEAGAGAAPMRRGSDRRYDFPATDPDAAYVLFTSGSSGRPKGVEISRAALANLVDDFGRRFALRPGDVVLHCAALTFDVSAWEIFVPLAHGAAICVADETTVAAPGRLTDLMRSERVTVVDVMPSLLDALDPDDFPDLRIVMTGIEPVPAATVSAWSRGGRPVFNGYGPTEATVIATVMECPPGPQDPPIGRPLDNVTAVVVDPDTLERVPQGERGELWLAGVQLATRYIGAASEQMDAFLEHRLAGLEPGRWYRTGDVVSEDEAGNLLYHGRQDDQIKIRGQRVRLGHVEASARRLPQVRACAVAIGGAPGAPRLVLALVPADGAETDTFVAEVLEHLRTALPPYMVPEEAIVLERLPTLANGKVDRRAIAAGPETAADADAEVPLDELALVERIVVEVLGAAPPDGVLPTLDSLAAIRIAGRLRQALGNDEAAAPDVLKARTLAELVEVGRTPAEDAVA